MLLWWAAPMKHGSFGSRVVGPQKSSELVDGAAATVNPQPETGSSRERFAEPSHETVVTSVAVKTP